MVGLGVGIVWVGYSLVYYGLTQVNGGNWGYLDLVIPSRWTSAKAQVPTDQGTQSPTATKNTSGVNPGSPWFDIIGPGGQWLWNKVS